MSRQIKCIGGPKNGEYIAFHGGRTYQIPIAPYLELKAYDHMIDTNCTMEIKSVTYRLERYADNFQELYYLIHEDYTNDEAHDIIKGLC